jgi:hypothetical protein
MLAVSGVLGGSGQLPEARAVGPECTDAVAQCPQQANASKPDLAPQRHLEISCQPARIGAFCTRRWAR